MKKIYKYLLTVLLAFSMTGCSSIFKEKDGVFNDPSSGVIVNPSGEPGEEPSENPSEEEPTVLPEVVDYCTNDANACVEVLAKTGQTYDPETEDLSDVFARVVKSVVTVISYDDKYDTLASGSGVIYATSENAQYTYVYTNAHVVSDVTVNTVGGSKVFKASFFEVIYYNNIRVEATLLGKDGAEDVAILQAEVEPSNDYLEATIGDSDSLKAGQTIFAVGSPLGTDYRNTVTRGVISGLNVFMETDNDEDGETTNMYLIQIDAALNSGNSGGPLFNLDGEFIGINTLKLTQSGLTSVEGFNFSIPSKHFVKVANQVLTTGSYTRPLIGISVMDIGDLSLSLREEKSIVPSLGLHIEEVVAGGAAEGKLVATQIITKINNVSITQLTDFVSQLLNYLPGEDISLTVVNLDGTGETTVTITLK